MKILFFSMMLAPAILEAGTSIEGRFVKKSLTRSTALVELKNSARDFVSLFNKGSRKINLQVGSRTVFVGKLSSASKKKSKIRIRMNGLWLVSKAKQTAMSRRRSKVKILLVENDKNIEAS